MQLTPLTMAAQMFEASKTCRAEDRKAIGDGREALARSLGQVEGMIKQRRSNDEQDWWLTWAATGGVLFGAFFALRSEEHTSELQSLMRISYAVFCLKQKHDAHDGHRHTPHLN